MSDYILHNHGSLIMVQPTHKRATKHLVAHTDGQWFGGMLAVEPRYAEDLSRNLEDDGFEVTANWTPS